MNQPDKTKLKYNLDNVHKELKGQGAENLRCLYSEYSERMRHSGAQIWLIGSVFIPLSLSGVVLSLSNPVHTLAIAGFSIFLIWVWYLISARIRTALDRDFAICAAIETAMLNLERPLTRVGLNELIVPLDKKKQMRLRHIRLGIAVFISAGWSIVAVVSFVI